MKPFTAFQLSRLTPAPAAIVTLPAPAAWSVDFSTASQTLPQQGHKVRQRATGAAHRAQVLTQRRTPVRTSAKRW